MFSVHNKLLPEKFQVMLHKNSFVQLHHTKQDRRVIVESCT